MNYFEKIVGYEQQKNELKIIADVLRNTEKYTKHGVSAPRGLLLYGRPGVGKTLMASCLVEASGRKAFVCRKTEPGAEFVKIIKSTFDKAAQNTPSVVFLDDMDKFSNVDEEHCDSEEYVTIQSCIDDVKGKEVFVIATANEICDLPLSLLRAGRFDRVVEVEPPKIDDSALIIRKCLEGKNVSDDVDTIIIARLLENRSCAQLETVINEAGVYAGYNRFDKITMEHIVMACMQVVFNIPMRGLYDLEETVGEKLHDSSNVLSQVIYH